MDYAQARRKARFMFGGGGDIRSRTGTLGPICIVGVVQQGKFKQLGAGLSWDEAFNSVKEVDYGEGSEAGEAGEAKEGDVCADVRAEGEASNTVGPDSTTSTTQRIKL